MLENGFTYKLILGEDGQIWSWGLDPDGNEVISQDLDAVTILDKFVREHPDFSPFGAKACMGLTGYEGIFGYRTNTDSENWTAEREAFRQQEIEAARPIIAELRRTGWTFASHTWGHIRLDSGNMEKITGDTQRWFDEVGSLIGETSILIYPHGARPDGNDWTDTGETFRYLQEQGFRVFASVGIESFSFIKKDISAVICDRLHPDGTTLRSSRSLERYMKFYDAREIIDLYEEGLDEAVSDVPFEHHVHFMQLPLRRVTLSDVIAAKKAIREYLADHPGDVDFNVAAHLQVHLGILRRAELQEKLEVLPTEVHIIRLGSIAIATNPFELFLDYGNQIKARSLAEQTFLIQLCCGAEGYLPTLKAENGGHYSAFVSSGNVGHIGGEQLVRETLQDINGLFSK